MRATKMPSSTGPVIIALILASALGSLAAAVVASVDANPCSSLVVRTDKQDYSVGEAVNITVTFVSLLPGCVEPMIAHDYLVTIDVLTPTNQTVFSSSNATARELMVSELWMPATAGEYTVVASAYFRPLGDESIMSKTIESSTKIHVLNVTQQIPEFGLVATGVFGIGVVALSLMLLRRRQRLTSESDRLHVLRFRRRIHVFGVGRPL